MIEALQSQYMLRIFREPYHTFLEFMQTLNEFPLAARLYRSYSISDLNFKIDHDAWMLVVSIDYSNDGVQSQLFVKGDTYQHPVRNRQTHFAPSLRVKCTCSESSICEHVRALIALYGSVNYPDDAPNVFRWRSWIKELPSSQKVSKNQAFIDLKMTKSKQDFSIKATVMRYGYPWDDLPDIDIALVRLLGEKARIKGKAGASIMDLIASSGRSIEYRSVHYTLSEPRSIAVEFNWTEKQGELSIKTKMPPKIDIIPCDPPYYVCQQTSAFGPATLAPGVAESLRVASSLGAIPVRDAREFSIALLETGSTLPHPDITLNVTTEKVKPKVTVSFTGTGGKKSKPVVELNVSRDEQIPVDGTTLVKTDENTYTRFTEDTAFVDNVSAQLKRIGIQFGEYSNNADAEKPSSPSLLTEVKSELESLLDVSQGSLEIEVDPLYPIEVQDYQGELDIDTSLDTSSNLINFTPGLLIKGKRVNLIKPILSLLEKLKEGQEFSEYLEQLPPKVLLDIDDTTALNLPVSVVKPLLQFIHDYSATRTSLHVTRFDAGALFKLQENLGGSVNRFYVDQRVEQSKGFFETLRNGDPIPSVKVPEDFIGHLEPYQEVGVSWLTFLSNYGFGGILADDMGAGKTRQLIAFLSVRRQQINRTDKPQFLILCPVNPTQDWLVEFQQTCPTISVYLQHGTGRAKKPDDLQGYEVIITTYGTFVKDEFLRKEMEFNAIVCDEIQDANNAKTNIFECISELKARCIFAASGTPMENSLEELRAVMDIVNRGYLGNKTMFNRLYTKPIVEDGCVQTLRKLRRKIGPFILRRKDGDAGINFNIPENDIETVYFDLEGTHLEQYEKVRMAGHTDVLRRLKQNGVLKGGVNVLPSITEMRRICCDLSLSADYTPQMVYRNPKMEYLVEELIALTKARKKALVFTYFSDSMEVISKALSEHGIGHVCIDGTDSKKSRDRKKDEFRENKTDHIIATLKAMNSGANLQNAHNLYLTDPWYNFSKEEQAIKRAHRKGLKHTLKTRRLLFNNSVEIGVAAIGNRKKALFDAVLEEDINYLVTGGITNEDIDLIFKSPYAIQ